ncbi:zinc finger CCHC domain-containing protein 8 homolog [Athalia rosae]|uniref:zinc finger CCHC domain-containing protein 8 homolog n=1 Tax=Athalia rosae TaxID=37344 RepID=UPI0020333965|nr:zinc finger CCHC domain-containing protein 8 homolog [Athalia rosae]
MPECFQTHFIRLIVIEKMAQSGEIDKSRKQKLLLDNDIYELDSEDQSIVASPEVIELEPSSDEVAILDESQVSEKLDNLSESVNFDNTVGPGVAPKGFILIDEDLGDTTINETNESETRIDHPPKKPAPIFQVIFRDDEAVRNYRRSIKKFLQSLVCSNTKDESDDPFGLVLEIWDKHLVPEEGEISGKPDYQETSDDQVFTIDTKPKLKDDLDIPTYGKKFKEILKKVEDAVADVPEVCGPKLACFNCDGNHNLRDCTERRDYAKVNKNRKIFLANQGPRNGRYHLDEEQKFGHFTPGKLSKNLRRALGLRDNELPKHIYSMRILGYPPGWMEEARVQHSGLMLFNSEGCAEGDPANDEEETVLSGAGDKFDVKKIFDFPGFNVDPPRGTRDEHKYYGTPQMQDSDSKKLMLSRFRGKKAEEGYKRKKMKMNRSDTITNSSIISCDMEIDPAEDNDIEILTTNGNLAPPLPRTEPPRPPDLPVDSENDNRDLHEQHCDRSKDQSSTSLSRDGSPSLSHLEVAKKQLLIELNRPGTPLDQTIRVNTPEPTSNTLNVKQLFSPTGTDLTPQSIRTQSRQSTPQIDPTGAERSVNLGTPVLNSTSPFNKLPSSEKFSKDICDVISFENLPNSTGKYEKLSEVLQKVRDKVTRIQQE